MVVVAWSFSQSAYLGFRKQGREKTRVSHDWQPEVRSFWCGATSLSVRARYAQRIDKEPTGLETGWSQYGP